MNLPTAPLPRYTNGEGVLAFLEMWATSGLSTTVSIRYTNQAGTPNRISQSMAIVGNQGNLDNLIPFMLADGDTGVRSVEGFTIASPSASVGNAGIVLMKKLCNMPVETGEYTERQGYRQMMFHGGMVEIMPGAFLQVCWIATTSLTGAWVMQGRIGVIEA